MTPFRPIGPIDCRDWTLVPVIMTDMSEALRPVPELLKAAGLPGAYVRLDNGDCFSPHGRIPEGNGLRPVAALEGGGVLPWAPVKAAAEQGMTVADVASPVLKAMHILPSSLSNAGMGATPLAAVLAGGLLGGTTGYLGGKLYEQFLDEEERRAGRYSRSGALLGGLAGTLPGLLSGVSNTMGKEPRMPPAQEVASAVGQALGGVPGVLGAVGSSESGGHGGPGPGVLAPEKQEGMIAPWLRPHTLWKASCTYVMDCDRDVLTRRLWYDPFLRPGLKAAAVCLAHRAGEGGRVLSGVLADRLRDVVFGSPVTRTLAVKAADVLVKMGDEDEPTFRTAALNGVWAEILDEHLAPFFTTDRGGR